MSRENLAFNQVGAQFAKLYPTISIAQIKEVQWIEYWFELYFIVFYWILREYSWSDHDHVVLYVFYLLETHGFSAASLVAQRYAATGARFRTEFKSPDEIFVFHGSSKEATFISIIEDGFKVFILLLV